MKKFLVVITGFLLIFGMVSQASALSFGDDYFLGTIDSYNNTPDQEATLVNNLIGITPLPSEETIDGIDYYRSSNDFGTLPIIDLDYVDDSDKQDNGTTTFDATGYEYVAGKYDGPSAGIAVWYLGSDFVGTVVLPDTWHVLIDDTWNDTYQFSLSHTTGMDTNPVPEPATMLLLGTGLVGLAVTGRKKFKK